MSFTPFVPKGWKRGEPLRQWPTEHILPRNSKARFRTRWEDGQCAVFTLALEPWNRRFTAPDDVFTLRLDSREDANAFLDFWFAPPFKLSI